MLHHPLARNSDSRGVKCLGGDQSHEQVGQFMAQYASYMHVGESWQVPEIQGHMLARAVKAAPSSAGGPDGWRPGELKLLPREAFDRLARFLRLVEATGRWPAELCKARTAIMAKGTDSWTDPKNKKTWS